MLDELLFLSWRGRHGGISNGQCVGFWPSATGLGTVCGHCVIYALGQDTVLPPIQVLVVFMLWKYHPENYVKVCNQVGPAS